MHSDMRWRALPVIGMACAVSAVLGVVCVWMTARLVQLVQCQGFCPEVIYKGPYLAPTTTSEVVLLNGARLNSVVYGAVAVGLGALVRLAAVQCATYAGARWRAILVAATVLLALVLVGVDRAVADYTLVGSPCFDPHGCHPLYDRGTFPTPRLPIPCVALAFVAVILASATPSRSSAPEG